MVKAEFRVIVTDLSPTTNAGGEAEALLRSTAQTIKQVLTDSIPPFLDGLSFEASLIQGTVEDKKGNILQVKG